MTMAESRFSQNVTNVFSNYYDGLLNLQNLGPAASSDIVATSIASLNDVADQLSNVIAEYNPSTTLDHVEVGRIMARANAAVAAVLEVPEVWQAYQNGGDVSQQIAGTAGAVFGGYLIREVREEN